MKEDLAIVGQADEAMALTDQQLDDAPGSLAPTEFARVCEAVRATRHRRADGASSSVLAHDLPARL
jgi:hypothetical protein